MKLLFLDIDGVLNSTRYWNDQGRNLPMGKGGALDPEAVDRLNTIVEATNTHVVLSSSWRGKGKSPQVAHLLRERGFRHGLYSSTPYFTDMDPMCRWREITSWITNNWDKVVVLSRPFRFVVLDDDLDAFDPTDDYWCQFGAFVNTNYLVGLQDDGVEMAVAFLNGGPTK